MQKQELHDDEEQEEANGEARAEEILPVLQKAYGAQRDKIIDG